MYQNHEQKKGKVRPKKHLGQHFLKETQIAEDIANLVPEQSKKVIEIGPGMGVMTQFLYKRFEEKLICIEIDEESVIYLKQVPWAKELQIVHSDFLQLPPDNQIFNGDQLSIIGNFPYNISSQIVFKVIDMRSHFFYFGGMFQREVARRLCAEPGSKEYGIPSVLLQTYYHCRYEFTVNEGVFDPPPKVKSGVISCFRKQETGLNCDPAWHFKVVKAAFSQRRKTLSNALKTLPSFNQEHIPQNWKGKRAEELSVEDFMVLAEMGSKKPS